MSVPQRAPRDQRIKNPTPFCVTERDLAILRALYEYRVLSTPQVQQLFFTNPVRARTRLQLLYHHGFVDRKFMGAAFGKMNTHMLHILDRRGAEALLAQGHDISWSRGHKRIASFFLQHTLALNTLRVAVTKACEQQGLTLKTWVGESQLKADYDRVDIGLTQHGTAVIPDSYCCLEIPQGTLHLFWEMDRGTMPSKRFKHKITAYIAYARNKLTLSRFGTHKFRVLTVTESPVRTANLKKATEAVGGRNRFWFSTLSDLTPATILTHPVWQIAGRSDTATLLH